MSAEPSATVVARGAAQVRADLERSFDDAVAEAVGLLENAFTRPDVPEGVNSYLEQRPPAFPSLPPRG
jgi:enoyl-CoA hydratase/carnithine racemase